MDHLWSPWRLPYVAGEKAEDGCVFCNAVNRGAGEPLTLWTGRHCFVILNKYPYNNGHLLVLPLRHTSNLVSLTPDELQELAVLTQRSEQALTEAYSPHGINVGVNLGKPAGAGVPVAAAICTRVSSAPRRLEATRTLSGGTNPT